MGIFSLEDRLKRARILLERKGIASSDFVNNEICASWGRCLEAGLDPLGEPKRASVSQSKLDKLLDCNDSLISLAMIEMENLHYQIAGSNFVILFTNQDGIILKSVLDKSLGSTPAADDFVPGNIWSETIRGTNALGSAVATGRPATVNAEEHFFRKFTGLTCAAAPIFEPEGKMVAVLDAASDCRFRQHHTLALVKMSCLTIENGLFRKQHRNQLILELHNRYEFLGTLQAGMLAISDDGSLIAANRQAKYLLQGISLHQNIPFENIFHTEFNNFLNTLYRSFPVWLTDLAGSSFAVRASNLPGSCLLHRYRASSGVDLTKGVSRENPYVFEDQAVQSALTQVERAVQLKVPVLIQGETGTGKEFLACYAHKASGRRGEFVTVNCAALPEALLESELFGYRGGAFTGASPNGAVGLVQRADRGTLFLDEIGEMPIQLQAKLLRFLDNWQVRPIGGTTDIRLDIQLITATNSDLSEAIASGKFRADLFYRINTVEVVLPPLRERTDFQLIVESILKTFNNISLLEEEAFKVLENYSWPGNIRELKSFLTRLLIDGEGRIFRESEVNQLLQHFSHGIEDKAQNKTLADQERNIVLSAYTRNKGNISAIARELGISRNKVYKSLKEARS
jgi:transcriptional regulator of acetoin/glycerol metabolism